MAYRIPTDEERQQFYDNLVKWLHKRFIENKETINVTVDAPHEPVMDGLDRHLGDVWEPEKIAIEFSKKA